MSCFKGMSNEFDLARLNADAIIFDGAANDQKAGQTICAHFQSAISGEHVLSLLSVTWQKWEQ